MKPGFLAPRGTVDKKPPHGAPCNRCGLCCVASLCDLASHVFRGRGLTAGVHTPGPCPALSYEGEQSICGLVASPGKFALGLTLQNGTEAMADAAKLLIGAATGCDARINGEPVNEAFYSTLIEFDRRNRSAVKRAKRLWRIA